MTCNFHYHKTIQKKKKKKKTNNHLQKKEATDTMHIQRKYRYSELFLNGHHDKTHISVKGTPYALARTFLYSLSYTVKRQTSLF